MNKNRWNNLVSLILTLCVTFSWNLPVYAQELNQDLSTVDPCVHKWKGVLQTMNCQHEERYVFFCQKCGKMDEDNIVIIIPGEFGDHTYETNPDKTDYGTCINLNDDGTPCGAEVTEGLQYCQKHGWTTTKILPPQEADCEEDGYGERLVCVHFGDQNENTKCETVYSGREPISQKLGHQEPEELPWTVLKEPTCSVEGKKQKLCRCGKIMAEEVIGTTEDHVYQWITEPVTCHTPETKVYQCNMCGKMSADPEHAPIEYGKPDPSLHTFDRQGACTNDGCQATLQTLGWVCPDHASAGVKSLSNVASTCTTPGKTKGFVCAMVGCTTIFLAQQDVPMTDHVFDEDGICIDCGAKSVIVTTNASGQIVDGNDKLTFGCELEMVDRDKIVEMGILYITKAGYTGTLEDAKADLTVRQSEMHGNTFTLTGREFARAKQYNIKDYADLGNYTRASVTFNFGAGTNRSRQVYARGYVIVQVSEGHYRIYYAKDVLTGTVGSFFPADEV